MFRFTTSRFHRDYGPNSLFERVKFKMKDVDGLKLYTNHFHKRCKERYIAYEILKEIENFSIEKWELVTVEVRDDKGKFINSTWEKVIGGERYWVTIGFGSAVQTVVKKDSYGIDKIIKNGPLYDFVKQVNTDLMLQDRGYNNYLIEGNIKEQAE